MAQEDQRIEPGGAWIENPHHRVSYIGGGHSMEVLAP
jgi:hypothetical protein